MVLEDYCPICGKYIENASKNAGNYFGHRCSKKSLAAINAARARIENNPESLYNITEPTFSEKIGVGCNMVNPNRDEDEIREEETAFKTELLLLKLKTS